MAIRLTLISMMQPKIISGLIAKTGEMVESINARTGLSRGVIKRVMTESSHTILHFNLGRDSGPFSFLQKTVVFAVKKRVIFPAGAGSIQGESEVNTRGE